MVCLRRNFSLTSIQDLTSRRPLLEKIFEMGRYWFILNAGKYPSIAAEVNSTINLQTAGAVQGNMREGMEAYFKWMEEITPDCRNNAKNIFGFEGTSYPLFPDKDLASIFIIPQAPKSEFGPIGFPQEAGAYASSGTITWSPAMCNFSATAWCQHIKNWRSSTKIS
jgi:hypothetical protein